MPADTVEIDVDLMRGTLEHIVLHKKNWDQHLWGKRSEKCGTSYCAGGWAVVLAGLKVVWVVDGLNGDWSWGNHVELEDGTTESILQAGRRVLGLNDWQTDTWFCVDRTLAQLWEWANLWTKGEIAIPEDMRIGGWAGLTP